MPENGSSKIIDDIAFALMDSIIVKKEWAPNERIPNERLLAERFDVSRSSVREAIKSLETAGYLTVRRGSGTYVAPNPGVMPDPLGFSSIEDTIEVITEWYQVRLILESGAMPLVVANAAEEQVAEICRLAEHVNSLIDEDSSSYLDADRDFHMLLARATHNTIMEKTLMSLHQSFYYRVTKEKLLLFNEMHQKNARLSHPQIAKFIKLRDAEGATLAMRLHMLYALKTTEESP